MYETTKYFFEKKWMLFGIGLNALSVKYMYETTKYFFEKKWMLFGIGLDFLSWRSKSSK